MIYLNNLKNYVKLNFLIIFTLLNVDCLAYTLHDAVIAAHENNYDIQAQQQALKAAQMALPKAYAGFLPTLQAQGRLDKTKWKQNNAANFNRNNTSLNLSLTQPLFDGFGSVAQVKSAEFNIIAAALQYKINSNQLSIDVIQAYTGVFYALSNYELNLYNVKVLNETLHFNQTRFDAGQLTITDVLQAEADLAQAIADKESAYGDIKTQEATFERLLGYKVPDNLEDVDLESIILPASIDELLEISLNNNPIYLLKQAVAQAAKYNVKISFSKILPSIYAQVQYNQTDGIKNPLSTYFSPDATTYSLIASVPIFQGGAQYADIKEKEYNAQQAKLDAREYERRTTESSIKAWNNYKTAIALIKAQNDAIIAADKAYVAVKEEARIGTKTTIDVLDAEKKLFSARVALLNAESAKINAIYNILQVMGSIDAVELNI